MTRSRGANERVIERGARSAEVKWNVMVCAIATATYPDYAIATATYPSLLLLKRKR